MGRLVVDFIEEEFTLNFVGEGGGGIAYSNSILVLRSIHSLWLDVLIAKKNHGFWIRRASISNEISLFSSPSNFYLQSLMPYTYRPLF